MAILIEAFNVIVNDDAFTEKPENRQLFLETIPTKAFCSDGLLHRVGFMDSSYAYDYINFLEQEIGLTYLDEYKNSKDIVIVNMLTGSSTNCIWFKFKRAKHFLEYKEYQKASEDFSIGWRIDSFEGIQERYLDFGSSENDETVQFNFDGLSTPLHWSPDNAIYSSNYFENPEQNLEKIKENNGVSTYVNKITGENTYIGTPTSSIYEMLENSEEFQSKIGGKLIRDSNGFLKLFGYRGNGLFNGELFNLDELTKFVINIVGNEYLKTEINLSHLNYLVNDKPNFIIKSQKDISIYVRVSDENGGNIDFDSFKNKKENNSYIRLAIITLWEFNNGNWEKVLIGKNGSKDGVYPYIVNLKYISFDAITSSDLTIKKLNHNELILEFEKTWKLQDSSIIEPYLDDNFNYYSEWIFDFFSSKIEYIEYLSGKFKSIKESNHKIKFDIIENEIGEYSILFDQYDQKAIFTIKTNEGKILEGKMAKISSKDKKNADNKIYYVPHTLFESKEHKSGTETNKISWFKKLFKKQ